MCNRCGGSRAGELLNLKIKHVAQDKYGYVLKVDGKTGQRSIRIIEAALKLTLWLNNHPLRKNPESPLWPKLTKNNYGKPLTYSAARQVLIRVSKNAKRKHENFNKRIFFTLFRHSEATKAANFMTQSQMTKRHGWVEGSKMPEKYVHLVNADVDAALFKHYGIKVEEDKESQTKTPKICPICEMPNSHDSELCSKCGKPLDLSVIIKIDEQNQQQIISQNEKIQNLENIVNNLAKRLDSR